MARVHGSKPKKNEVVQRLKVLERAQGETNQHLDRIEQTLATSSKIFELMHERLEHLETGQQALVEGQQRVIDRLDRLVDASIRDRTFWVDRLTKLEERVGRLEHDS